MQISERLSKIRPSSTLAINTRAQQMKACGIPVISLAVGEPDFHTPDFVKEAAKRAIDQNFTRYTPVPGIPELRKAAANYFDRYYGTKINEDWIIISPGGKSCLYTFMQATLNPGDEVLIPSPYWVSYPDMVLLAGAKPVFVPAGLTSGFKVTPDMLEEKYTEKTRLLIINSPNNPTGAIYSQQELNAILEWALSKNIFTLSDEIYDQLVFPPAVMASVSPMVAEHPENFAVVNGLSKSFAMTGWRVGFLAADPNLIKNLALLQGHSLSNVCSIAQKAALAALTGPHDSVDEMREAFERRRNLALNLIKTWVKAICPKPDGAFYLFVDVSGYFSPEIPDSTALCAWILEKANVATVPGAAFGNDNCLRLSYAVGDDTLDEALSRIGEALNKL